MVQIKSYYKLGIVYPRFLMESATIRTFAALNKKRTYETRDY